MSARIVGWFSFGAAAVWSSARLWLPEFVRAFIYDRLLHMLNPYLIDFGPPVAFAALGTYLFWRTGGWDRRLPKKAVGVPAGTLEPMHKVISHVAKRIADNEKYSPAARLAIRQGAIDGELHIYGHQSGPPRSNQTGFNSARVLIPATYWELNDITVMATEPAPDDQFVFHTMPHQLSNGVFVEDQKLYYANLSARWDEVMKLWP